MTPLQITAHLRGPIQMPHSPINLDSLLAATIARRDQLPPPRDASECQPIEIPVEREPGGRFHLASVAQCEVEASELRWVNRRAPAQEYAMLGSKKIRTVQITAGSNKSYRIPVEANWLVGDKLTWWCIGDESGVRDLLAHVTSLGKKRSTGNGQVGRWEVAQCDTWPGFPVVRGGRPLRNLPTDWPGLNDPETAYRRLTYPYWDHATEELCACP